MELRGAVVEDAAAIALIQVTGWQSAYRGIVPQGHLDAMTTGKRETYWRQAIAEDTPLVVVATHDDAVVGWIAFGGCRDEDRQGRGELWAVYVLPQRVGTGVGRALSQEACRHLQKLGYADASLWVLARNARARQFYERAGFVMQPDSTKQVVIAGEPLAEVRYVREFSKASDF